MNGFYFLTEGSDAVAVHEMTKENEVAHSQNTLLSIDDDAVLTESLEYQSKVCEVLSWISASYEKVIYICVAEV